MLECTPTRKILREAGELGETDFMAAANHFASDSWQKDYPAPGRHPVAFVHELPVAILYSITSCPLPARGIQTSKVRNLCSYSPDLQSQQPLLKDVKGETAKSDGTMS